MGQRWVVSPEPRKTAPWKEWVYHSQEPQKARPWCDGIGPRRRRVPQKAWPTAKQWTGTALNCTRSGPYAWALSRDNELQAQKITQGMVRRRKHYSRVEDNGWPIPNSDHEMFKTAAPPWYVQLRLQNDPTIVVLQVNLKLLPQLCFDRVSTRTPPGLWVCLYSLCVSDEQ